MATSWQDFQSSYGKMYSAKKVGDRTENVNAFNAGYSKPSGRTPSGGGSQSVPTQYDYSGGGGHSGGKYKSGFNWEEWIPQLPKTPVVTAALIAEWLKRAQDEAALQYDPQKLAINQQLQSSILASEQQKAGIPVAYDEIIKEIQKWQEESMKSEQQRHYARGFGRSGVLLEQEQEIGEKALEETTAARTEQARLMADIDAQVALLKNQAGEKQTGLEASRATYITSRQAELRDAYEQNQQALAQQQFANQMAIAEFGLNAETAAFNQYLQQSQLELDQWYTNSLNSLSQESAAMNAAAAGSMTSANTSTQGTGGQLKASLTPTNAIANAKSTTASAAQNTKNRLLAWMQGQGYPTTKAWQIGNMSPY